MSGHGSDAERPLLRVVRGDPTPEELAALTVVLAAKAATPGQTAPAPRFRWRDRQRLMRRPLDPGPGAWRASART